MTRVETRRSSVLANGASRNLPAALHGYRQVGEPLVHLYRHHWRPGGLWVRRGCKPDYQAADRHDTRTRIRTTKSTVSSRVTAAEHQRRQHDQKRNRPVQTPGDAGLGAFQDARPNAFRGRRASVFRSRAVSTRTKPSLQSATRAAGWMSERWLQINGRPFSISSFYRTSIPLRTRRQTSEQASMKGVSIPMRISAATATIAVHGGNAR